jgi:23S rRNA pseudouridine955/2504/2580 synthase
MAAKDVRSFIVSADDAGIRLDRWCKRNIADANFALVARWARTGQLRLDSARAKPGDRVSAGQVIRIPPDDVMALQAAASTARKPRPRRILSDAEMAFAQALVIHQDAHAIAINKPAGLATQGGTKTTEHVDGLLDALQGDMPGRPKLVHRLDKDTSGVLLLARSARAATHYGKAFLGRSAQKTYWAIIMGVPNIGSGEIDLALAKQPGTGGEKMMVDPENGQFAKTRYRVIDRAGNRAAWVELMPLTGRTHQLRAHMAAIGHPIVGDGKYGGKEAYLTGTISRKMHLHARRLRIEGPEGQKLDVSAQLPDHFTDSLKQLGFDLSAGDSLAAPAPKLPAKLIEKKAAKAHAKDVRRERKGERRGRGQERRGQQERVTPSKNKKPKSAAAKPAASKPSVRRSAKPAPRTPSSRPASKPKQ